MKINPSDIHYSYDTRGYMMYYKDKPIGGAGLAKGVSGCRANLKLFKEQAELEKRRILNGIISKYMLEEIQKNDNEETKCLSN